MKTKVDVIWICIKCLLFSEMVMRCYIMTLLWSKYVIDILANRDHDCYIYKL